MRRPAYTALSALLTTACGYSQEAGQKLQTQVYAQETQLQALQSAMNDAQQTIAKQGKEIASLNEQVGALNQAARRNDADFGAELDTVKLDMSRLKGLVEGSKERLDTIESQVTKVSEELDLRFQGLAEKAKGEAARSEEEKARLVEEARQRERLLSDPKALIDHVVSLVNAQKPGEARKLLREFQIRAKEDPKLERYAGDAQYLIGETFYLEGSYQLAATEYNNLRKNYPKSPRVPDALYKMGMCFEALKLPEDAKLFYQTVIKTYPKAEAANQAKVRLRELK